MTLTSRYHLSKTLEEDYIVTEKVLGTGYSGSIREATSKLDGKRFAVKAFKIRDITPDQKEQVQSEVKFCLEADHPNIVRLRDVYESDEFLYLVMDCMEGGELFDRVAKLKVFSEKDANAATKQILLAVSYLHQHNIVHRDLKLENFLFESEDSNHLKLIDFGISKIYNPDVKMEQVCGTMSYMAPEVLNESYGIECDLWSLGVIVFVLLAGHMPFKNKAQIKNAEYTMFPEKWKFITQEGRHFVQSLLVQDPSKRLTARTALSHPWMSIGWVQKYSQSQALGENEASPAPSVDRGIVDALSQFGQATKFRRCCLVMMAWCLSNEERATVQQHFIAMDENHTGTITLGELRKVVEQFEDIPKADIDDIIQALDYDQDERIQYSEFLAAMVSTRIQLHDDLLRNAFARFDQTNTGFITVDDLRAHLGEDEDVASLLKEVKVGKDGKISYQEFAAYIRGSSQAEGLATRIIDQQTAEIKAGRGAQSFGGSDEFVDRPFDQAFKLESRKKRSLAVEALRGGYASYG